ncbi:MULTISPECIES: hypothetical protein [Streptomyces]|uniref:Uncharacterized protein n=1 Tax=Streptomyces siderophoricus TaxID=2802281 RepID=A0ABS1N0C3_9ACTN|nr:hypothetical protein [Streptomyces sp. 9-7]MBL1093501.1 hypothetical protein [Streptomyces sp. 9-7]
MSFRKVFPRRHRRDWDHDHDRDRYRRRRRRYGRRHNRRRFFDYDD